MQAAISLLTSGFQALTGAGAGTAATATGAAAGAAGSGFSLSSILQGTASVLGAFSAIGAGEADATQMELEALDAEREMPLETLQGITRRTSIKRELLDSVSGMDAAYAASGVDLSFGTPSVARTQAFREADRALSSDVGTEQTRVARLDERARNYRRAAGRARSRGFMDAAGGLAKFGASVVERG